MTVGTKVRTTTGLHGVIVEIFHALGVEFAVVLMANGVRNHRKLESLTEVE